MSFILDALRKSESERQQRSAPGLADARYRVAGARPSRWLPALAIVLGANALLLAVLLFRQPEPTAAATPRVTRPAPLPPAPPEPPPEREIRPLEAEIAEPAAAEVPAVAVASPPAAGATAAPAAASAPPRRKSSISEAMPSLQQLVVAGELELPPLRIDIHVFSEARAQRFVFINMAKYREGEKLREGPVLESITTDGVILEHQGRRFTLARE